MVLITLDGVRIEEIFGGLNETVARAIVKEGPPEDSLLWRRYWAPTPEERRRKLMPFFWGTLLAEHGSIAGNQAAGSVVRVTNRHRFSYPGYAEIATGAAHDSQIDSNDNRRNPFPTVLEIVRRERGLDRREVATFASWETFRWIAEHEEGATTVNAGLQAYAHPDAAVQVLSEWQFQARTPWDGARHDAYTLRFARAHLATYHPRLLWIALDETDDWAHDGRYDRVLDSLAGFDRALADLWTWLQADPQIPRHDHARHHHRSRPRPRTDRLARSRQGHRWGAGHLARHRGPRYDTPGRVARRAHRVPEPDCRHHRGAPRRGLPTRRARCRRSTSAAMRNARPPHHRWCTSAASRCVVERLHGGHRLG